MRQGRQKQEPFFVKRIRLRKSVIKTSQILQNISIVGQQTIKYSTLSDNFRRKQIGLISKGKKITLDQTCMSEFESLSNNYQLSNMKNIIKIYKNTREKQAELDMKQVGLEVRRIVGDPSHKKSHQFSCQISDKARTKREASTLQRFNLTSSNNLTIDSSENQIGDYQFCEARAIQTQKTDRNGIESMAIGSPIRRNKVYLYQKLAQSQKVIAGQQNQIYEKRIQSYTDFLWKMMLAHNIYNNIDLGLSHSMIKKMKCYIGYGNNCNMIKGLIKRRFWWTISEELSQDCLFVWTQIKVNKIFEKQQRSHAFGSKYLDSGVIEPNFSQIRITQSTSLNKRSGSSSNFIKRLGDQKFTQLYSPHRKIWNEADFCILEKYCKKSKIITTEREYRNKKTKKTYTQLTYQIRKKYKEIAVIEEIQTKQEEDLRIQPNSYYRVQPIVHNHLQNNFFLGNKKALFYNLRQYYTKKHIDPFEFIPLTFHIKKGFKDPQYNRFIKYYGARAKQIRQQTEEGQRSKLRNIWIVKPGQNSNQGRGITVIDQVYELNQIIKDSIVPTKKSTRQKSEKQQQSQRTFIVQMYIDRPFLYNSRKFDIRHYMLITNLFGITRAYWYDEGYVRTSSYIFNINNFQPEIHLTNDAIQKQYPEYGRYQNANKVSYSEFQGYLNTYSQKKYNFRDEILPKMKEMATDAAKSVYNKISPMNLMHNFEIFGLDFMIDRDFKPWLIEINTNPCLDCVCPLLQRIIPYMVEQSLKLSLDIVYPPPCHYPNTSKHYAPMVNLSNFKYELIFDSNTDGKQIKNLYKRQNNLLKQIGELDDDQEFIDNGKQAKLQDFT